MILSKDILQAIDSSVLCWLATSDATGQPNVSPKEIFCAWDESYLIIANIASPQSARNIQANSKVSVSFIDILVQKGYQLKGTATLIDHSYKEYLHLKTALEQLTGGKFPFNSIFKIAIEQSKPILSPRYLLYPDTTETAQKARAREQYGLK